ncbi:podocalyxin isoform X2 [Grus americana]|uniref:podocalyxin isoform X2 n=1 Tax=Grus americana TaxID=9117 RepID=UPI002407BB60|nr:podocalyxin isoform X2 [Grus americana]
MRAPLLLPLLPLLLLGVSSQDVTKPATESPGEKGQITMTTNSSKMKGTSTTSSGENPLSTSTVSSATVQRITPIHKPGSPPLAPVIPPSTVQGTTPTSSQGNPPSASATSATAVKEIIPTNNTGNPPPTHRALTPLLQQASFSNSSGASTATPTTTFSVTQKISPPASLGSSAAVTATKPVPTHMSSSPTTPRSLGTTVTSAFSVEPQASQRSDQLTSTTASTRASSRPPGLKDYGVFSPTSVAKQPHSSPSSPVQGLASSTKPGTINISVTPLNGSVSLTTSKASLSLSSGSINKVSEAATSPAPEADQGSHDSRTASTKPASADQSPAHAQPSAPALWDQTASSSPGHQHPNVSFPNKVICKDQVQNNWPTIYLKEAKTCAEWKTTSDNISFFESFCSTGQHAFNASRETCTVTLASREPRSQHWAVWAIVHLPLDPEKVLEELKEKKDKLEKLGIANITYDKMEREMVINDEFSTPLIITIVTLAGSLLLIAAIYGCCHQRFSQKKDQHIHPDLPGFDDGHVALIFNRLTEELQTMENGYHDNPTLEVMETSSEMQEKKVNLNGELGDSWIVPLDTLMKEDLEEEEDTHL